MTTTNKNSNPGSCCLSYGETEWIDWLLNKYDSGRISAMGAHAESCASCREIVAYWQPLLAIGADDDWPAGQPHELPRPSIPDKLRKTVQSIGRRRLAVQRWKRVAPRIAALAFLAWMMWSLTGLVGQGGNQTDHARDEYVAHYEPGAMNLVNDPQTASYRISSNYGDSGQSYVWLNVRSGEMLVLVDGLLPSKGYSIQAWAISERDHVNLGLLRQLELRRAHLYVKNAVLSDYRNVSLTIEPDGGSSAPTTPDILLLPLRE